MIEPAVKNAFMTSIRQIAAVMITDVYFLKIFFISKFSCVSSLADKQCLHIVSIVPHNAFNGIKRCFHVKKSWLYAKKEHHFVDKQNDFWIK